MDTEVFLYPAVLTDRYYFMQTVKKEYDFATDEGFPRTDLMYDREEKAIYKYSLSSRPLIKVFTADYQQYNH